jgi:hypothetical protein
MKTYPLLPVVPLTADLVLLCAGRIFHKNFSLLGVGNDSAGDRAMMLKEGQATFKFYASGRRFCQGMLTTLHLQARQDLFMTLLSVVQPATDLVR